MQVFGWKYTVDERSEETGQTGHQKWCAKKDLIRRKASNFKANGQETSSWSSPVSQRQESEATLTTQAHRNRAGEDWTKSEKKWYNFTSSPLIPEYESAKPATLSPWSIYTYIDWRSHGFLISQKSLTGHTQNLAPLRILTNKLPSITDRGDVGSTHLPLLLLISHTRHVETPFSPFEVWMNPK